VLLAVCKSPLPPFSVLLTRIVQALGDFFEGLLARVQAQLFKTRIALEVLLARPRAALRILLTTLFKLPATATSFVTTRYGRRCHIELLRERGRIIKSKWCCRSVNNGRSGIGSGQSSDRLQSNTTQLDTFCDQLAQENNLAASSRQPLRRSSSARHWCMSFPDAASLRREIMEMEQILNVIYCFQWRDFVFDLF
jgi:hypothetical protein